MTPTDIPQVQPDVVLTEEFPDCVLLFLPLTGEVVGIEPVGLLIWKLIDGQRTVAQIAAEVTAQCQDAPPSVLEDTLAFLENLNRRLFISLGPQHG